MAADRDGAEPDEDVQDAEVRKDDAHDVNDGTEQTAEPEGQFPDAVKQESRINRQGD